MQENKDFAKLRELLSDPEQSREWNDAFCALLLKAQTENLETYREVWLPYCEEHKETLRAPLKTLDSIGALQEWAERAPFALFSLDMGAQNLCDEGCAGFTGVTHLKQLRKLALEENRISDNGWGMIVTQDLSQLESIDLGWNLISDQGCASLASTKTLANLEYIELRNNYIGDRGCFAIAQSEYLTKVRYLGLCGNELGDEGCAALAQTKHLQTLKHLDLDANHIGTQGCIAIANSPYLTGLDSLVLDGDELDAEAALVLACSVTLSKNIRESYAERVPEALLVETLSQYHIEAQAELGREALLQLIWDAKAEH